VDHATTLELGHPAKREPQQLCGLGLADAQRSRQLASQIDHRPTPQLRRTGVLEHSADVVVTVGAQRCTHEFVVGSVALSADRGAAVDTTRAETTVMTVASGPHGVDCAEAGGGQGEEDGWVLGDAVWDSLSALEPRAHQMTSIASVDRGTCRAAHLISRPAGFEEHAVGQGSAREADSALACVRDEDAAPQADRMAAPAAAVPLGQELIDLATASVAHQRFEHGVVLWIHAGHGGSEL
jgi:hypothetical protein